MDRDGMEKLADPDRLTFPCKDEMRTTVTRFDQALHSELHRRTDAI